MTAFALCDDCRVNDHCHGTGDRPLTPAQVAAGVCGGFYCSCECRSREKHKARVKHGRG